MPEAELSTLQLPERYLAQVRAILRNCLPGVEVWAYGSRVNGDCYEASDLDLVARFPENETGRLALFATREAFVESDIPIIVQIVDWAAIPASFHSEILHRYVVVQTPCPLPYDQKKRRL